MKILENRRFSDVFRGSRSETLVENGLSKTNRTLKILWIKMVSRRARLRSRFHCLQLQRNFIQSKQTNLDF